MADFLTRLAERTLGVAQVVQPIIAPIFAPEPAPTREALTVQHEERALEAPTQEADQSAVGTRDLKRAPLRSAEAPTFQSGCIRAPRTHKVYSQRRLDESEESHAL